MTIFTVLLVGGPCFLVAGVFLVRFRTAAAQKALRIQRSAYGYGKIGDNQTRSTDPVTVGAVGGFWIVAGIVAICIGLVHFL